MAHIEIDKREFDELVGEEISDERLEDEASFLGAHWNHVEGPKWDVEVYPNRPDLLSVEGLARAYRGFFNIEPGRQIYEARHGDFDLEVDSSVEDVRPFIGGAVIRGLELSEKKINGLIQLQEKLHQTVGRRRDKIAIGLHDLSELEPPFTYRAVKPDQVSFTPLDGSQEMQLGRILEKHEKGREYSWILEGDERYPVIEDSEGRVLSFPPIINNQLTEVSPDTTDLFIDVTGKDRQTVSKVLNILATALAERGGAIEIVEVDGKKMPDLSPEVRELDPDYLKQISGLELSNAEVAERLEMMKYGVEQDSKLDVEVPCYRMDIMHQYDLIEDVVIAHRYDNIEPEMPEVDQIGSQRPLEEFTAFLRDILQGTGAMEANTYVLSSREKLFDSMNVPEEEIVVMSNALTEEYSVVRNWLLPSLMGVLNRNRQHSYPQKFFELADTAVLDGSPVGVSNRRKLAYVIADKEAGYTDIRQMLQVVEREMDAELAVNETVEGCFREGRAGEITVEGEKIGIIGELSEEVVDNWGLKTGVAGLELDVERLREFTK